MSIWSDDDWKPLLLAIRHGQCTPFLGAGACAGTLPLGEELARNWAKDYSYPFADQSDLVRVAQYVGIKSDDGLVPRYLIRDAFQGRGTPDFTEPDEPHAVVAALPLAVYLTTNYDDFLVQALDRQIPKRAASRVVCQWFEGQTPPPFLEPTVSQPLVFHLHGALSAIESMVVTEDDYLDFLMALSEDVNLIPPRVQRAIGHSTVMFMGYSLNDMNFKVVFRRFAKYIRRGQGARHVAVQLAPDAGADAEAAERQRDYLAKALGTNNVKVYWGSCREFAGELRQRWTAFGG